MHSRRVILVPPASPGSKGDEAMVRGSIEIFARFQILILNPGPGTSWVQKLRLPSFEGSRVSEVTGPIQSFAGRLEPGDILFVIGADVIDGTCGLEASFARIDLMEDALVYLLPVYATFSFRSDVAPQVLKRLRHLQEAKFLVRDEHSLSNFLRQTGLPAIYFPDLSFFFRLPVDNHLAQRITAQVESANGQPIIGLNFAEHSFRSFYDEHTYNNRKRFVEDIIQEISKAYPCAYYVLLSNDERHCDGHPSDDAYADMAYLWVVEKFGSDRVLKVDPIANYADNVAILGLVDILVTGRMHLSFAAFRAGTLPLVMMGTTRGYTSVDKMRGAFATHLHTTDPVISEVTLLGPRITRFLAERKQLRGRLNIFTDQMLRSTADHAAALLSEIITPPTNEQVNCFAQSALLLLKDRHMRLLREEQVKGQKVAQEIIEQQHRMEALENRITSAQQASATGLAGLAAANILIAEQRRELDAVYASRSWRLTAPIRRFASSNPRLRRIMARLYRKVFRPTTSPQYLG